MRPQIIFQLHRAGIQPVNAVPPGLRNAQCFGQSRALFDQQ
jgi:hypothetical protein